jgi:nickel-dependent lactate racemase
MKFALPYGKTKVEIDIPNDIDVKLIRAKSVPPLTDPSISLINTLDQPISSQPLSSIIKNMIKKSDDFIVIVVDDNTRKFPFDSIIPPLLKYIHDLGIKKEQIKFLIAGGTHKAPSQETINSMFGKVAKEYTFYNNDQSNSKFRRLGVTSYKSPVEINEEYLKATVKILLTDVTLHYFAGFGGDRKSLYPGLASAESVNTNHKMVTDRGVGPGVLKNNPIHEDMLEGARMAGADFVINVCLNDENQIFDIKSGALNDAFLKAVENYIQYFQIQVDSQADVLILSAGGYPYDINFYQSQKAIQQCRIATKEGGIIIYLTESKDGIGNSVFAEWIEKYKDPESVKLAIQKNFVQGGNNAYYQYKFSERNKIYVKSELLDSYMLNTLKMSPIHDIQKLLQEINMKGKKVYIIETGAKIMIKLKNE